MSKLAIEKVTILFSFKLYTKDPHVDMHIEFFLWTS